MAIEIVSFPIKNGGSFHSYVSFSIVFCMFTRGYTEIFAKFHVPQDVPHPFNRSRPRWMVLKSPGVPKLRDNLTSS